jgi:hypothetical protein
MKSTISDIFKKAGKNYLDIRIVKDPCSKHSKIKDNFCINITGNNGGGLIQWSDDCDELLERTLCDISKKDIKKW